MKDGLADGLARVRERVSTLRGGGDSPARDRYVLLASGSGRRRRLADLITTKRELALDKLLAEDSTFYGDLFPHVVEYQGALYLEDGLHRALRAALQQRNQIHARVLVVEG